MLVYLFGNLLRVARNFVRLAVINARNKGARISPFALIGGAQAGNIVLRPGASIGAYTVIIIESDPTGQIRKTASLEVGENTYIGELNNIRINVPTRIGKNCLISQCCSIITTNHKISGPSAINVQGWDEMKTGVVIEDNVWIGANCCILPGVTIGSGSVVAAGSVVVNTFPPNSILAGCPARIKGSRPSLIS